MRIAGKVIVNPMAHQDHELDDFGIEAGVRYPFWGRGWPADPVFSVGVSGKFRVFDAYSR